MKEKEWSSTCTEAVERGIFTCHQLYPTGATMHADARPLRVLIVDDNRDNADSLAMIARAWGHEARATYSGPTALTTLPGFSPDVMIVDLAMPAMDGNAVARQVRAMPDLAGTKLIAMTGYHSGASHELFDHHLLKPADLAELEKLLVSAKGSP